MVDEFTRESLSDLVAHSIDADATVACLDRIVGERGCFPHFIRCDNGPELTANAVRDWGGIDVVIQLDPFAERPAAVVARAPFTPRAQTSRTTS